jgi:hypothetical protein
MTPWQTITRKFFRDTQKTGSLQMNIKTGRKIRKTIGRDRPTPPIEVCKDGSLTQAETTRLSRRNLDEGGNGLVSKPRTDPFL